MTLKELFEKYVDKMFVLDRAIFPLFNRLLNEHHHYLTIIGDPKADELIVKVTKDEPHN